MLLALHLALLSTMASSGPSASTLSSHGAARILLLCLLACGAGRCDAGDDVSPRDEVIVLAASHLGEHQSPEPL